jgi:hypothetical protein
MSGWSTYIVSGWIDEIAEMILYATLVSSDPDIGDPLSAEVIGPHYVRQPTIWTRSSPTSLVLANSLVFAGLGVDTHVAGMAVFDEQYNGNLVASQLLEPVDQVDFPTGGSYSVAAGAFAIAIDPALF